MEISKLNPGTRCRIFATGIVGIVMHERIKISTPPCWKRETCRGTALRVPDWP